MIVSRRQLRWWKPILVLLALVGYVAWWLLATWDRVASTSPGADIRWVSVASDGTTIITQDANYQGKRVRAWRWDRDTGIQPHALSIPIWPGTPVALRGEVLAAVADTKDRPEIGLVLWDVVADREIRRMDSPQSYAEVLAFSGDGSLLAAIGSGVLVFDVATGKVIRTIDPETRLCCGGITSTGVVVAGTEEGKLFAWGPGKGPPNEGPRLNLYVKHLDVAPSGAEVAIQGARHDEIEVLSLPDLRVVTTFRTRHPTLHSLRYSPGGDMLAVTVGTDSHPWPAGSWGWVDVYDIPGYQLRKTFRWFYGAPHTVALMTDSRLAVVGSRPGWGGGLTVWRVQD